MRTVSTKDGSKTFYKKWGSGQPIVFFHGWPPSTAAGGARILFAARRSVLVSPIQ
jgi:non-heme chloroperoxidase